ncbi:UPF0496 protein At1g20180-like [Andrographis paniculata]|uniref:UPF0496 protein At1g20180-like n=1 Tax=Andrographis paniculata TaxID=175694 RepID=UPI0021E9877D|nr:UPF0496 protein At1g20180-like [Andrographis paniculata]
MAKMLWSRLGICFGFGGSHEKEKKKEISVEKTTNNVNEEYNEAFRTRSYADMCNKIHNQFETPAILHSSPSSSSSLSSSTELSSPHFPASDCISDGLIEPQPETLTCIFKNSDLPLSSSMELTSPHSPAPDCISDSLIEPQPGTLTSIFENSDLPESLASYFQIGLDAGRACESLLRDLNQVRINHRCISKLLKLTQRSPDSFRRRATIINHHKAYINLATFAVCRNPFTVATRGMFHEMHDAQVLLLRRLTSQHRKTKRRTKLIRRFRQGMAAILAIGGGALAVILLFLSIPAGAGAVLGGLIVCTLAAMILKKLNRIEQRRRGGGTWVEGLDIAAKGVYILINDFEMVSRMVERVEEEVDRRKFVAEMCVRRKMEEMLRGVVGELETNNGRFGEELEELEKQIYLCLLDINRSRRLLLHEIMFH